MKASVAKIPWVTGSFTGFIAGLWVEDTLYRFTTYNRSKLLQSRADETKVILVMENPQYRNEIYATRDHANSLASPIQGLMYGRIEESMTSSLQVRLTKRQTGKLIFEDTGRNAGLEVAGKIEEIFI